MTGQGKRLTLLFACTYMVSYITRVNYSAVLPAIEAATALPRGQLSLALTGSAAAYGMGQLVSGVLGDRMPPKKLVSLGLLVTVLMNVCLPFCRHSGQLLVVCCINGFAQSFMWPPLVRLMTALLSEKDYQRAVVKVSWGSSVGTIAVYLTAPVLIELTSWQSVFFFSAVCGAVMLPVWQVSAYRTSTEKRLPAVVPAAVATPAAGKPKRRLPPLILGIMTAILLQGMLRDGVAAWMPSYIAETYRLGSAVSVLTGVALPVFSILCYQAASRLYIRRFPNPLQCAGVFFAAGTAAALLLLAFTGRHAALSVLFSAALTGCMHGVNLMLVCMLPPFFKKYSNVSTVSGLLNFCTYVGSALSTYGSAVLSECAGWKSVILMWLAASAAGAGLCFACARRWRHHLPAD